MYKPKQIILHHSLTKDSTTVSWGAIREFHVNRNGWEDIGYHYGIENLRGQTEILMGRMLDVQGAHCLGHNHDSIGICFVGNFDDQIVPKESWNAGIKLVRFLTRQYDIQDVIGHKEVNPRKTCPGGNFDLDKFREEVLS